MKPRHRLLLSAIVLTVTLGSIFVWKSKVNEEFEDKEATSGVKGQLWSFWWARAYPDPTNITAKWMAAWEHEQALRMPDITTHPEARNYGNWTNLPFNNGPGGRILTLAIHPTNPNTVFAGSASGGIWKTTNGGTSWSHVPVNLPLLGVSSIIINGSDPNVLLAGTGEVYRNGNSNIGFNVWKARGTYGIGIIKSTDGGATWSQKLVKLNSELFGIQKLTFGHNGYDTVYACATDGLYRSIDGGETWSNIAIGKNYVTDVVINSGNTNEIMIAVGNLTDSDKGIYRTTNGKSGAPTWTKVTSGVPSSFTGLVRFAYAGGQTVYASFSNLGGDYIKRTGNFGTSWSDLTSSVITKFQHWCTNVIKLNPHNTNQMMLGGVELYRYTISSASLSSIHGSLHDDIHDVVWHPTNPEIVYVACDGGVYKSTTGGGGWSKINTGLEATQFYAPLGVSTTTANFFVGGLQDNGAWRYSGGTWTSMTWMGGDGTACAIKPGDNQIFLTSRDARGVYRTGNGGSTGDNVLAYWGFKGDSRTAFAAPIAFAPSSPSTVYCATDVLHKSDNNGISGSWTNAKLGNTPPYPATTPNNHIEQRHKTAIALAVSPTNANKLYVSTSPFAQYDNDVDNLYYNPPPNVLKSTNGESSFSSIKSNLPNAFVMDFAISATNDDSVFVAVGGYGHDHIWVTGNGGTTWTPISNGLPDVPFNAILIDKLNPNFLYAGSDMGIYVSNNRGQTWYAFSNGFDDVTMVYDLQMTADNKIVAATHGRGLWIGDRAENFPLPTQLVSFTGRQRNEYNELKWEVTDDKDAARYELERKIDDGSYKRIATIASRNSTNLTAYSYNDDIRNTGGTNYYYRLKIVDRDGSYKYSNVVVLKITRPAGVEVLGNPVSAESRLRITLTSPQPVLFKLYDSKGSLVRTSKVNAPQGSSMHPISMFGVLPKGHYTLEVITKNERFTKRLIAR
jgi:Uncharacterized protein related to plant photosystem II stability/assembly factor